MKTRKEKLEELKREEWLTAEDIKKNLATYSDLYKIKAMIKDLEDSK